jgi:hypothetical protein
MHTPGREQGDGGVSYRPWAETFSRRTARVAASSKRTERLTLAATNDNIQGVRSIVKNPPFRPAHKKSASKIKGAFPVQPSKQPSSDRAGLSESDRARASKDQPSLQETMEIALGKRKQFKERLEMGTKVQLSVAESTVEAVCLESGLTLHVVTLISLVRFREILIWKAAWEEAIDSNLCK